MRQGQALLEARGMLGPEGHVRRQGELLQVGLFKPEVGFSVMSDGSRWEEALGGVRVLLEEMNHATSNNSRPDEG